MSTSASLDLDRLPLLVTAGGELLAHGAHCPADASAILPGSFNPVHAGHWELAAAASRLLQRPVVFELSVVNVDKPELTADEVQHRLAPFAGRASVWLTRAPRFVDKAELFPSATFVLGADTALRLVQPRYYGDDAGRMMQALAKLRDQGCRLLVGGRCDASGRFVTLEEVPAPAEHRDLFLAIPAHLFRADVSSTALRKS